MTEGLPEILHQSVLIEQGTITAIEEHGSLQIPDDAVHIDGRDLYLAPGMTEMHLHITSGGQQAAEEAGLLMIANGITSALNMGSTFLIDIPGLGDRFESGELIGPSLYVGQVAYGQRDNASAIHTVRSAVEATAYAQRLSDEGYDFIKFYWQLLPAVIQQFVIESERLGLPIVGHIPMTQSMRKSLSGGQQMAAHIQEPYVTQMDSIREERRIPAAANVFLENGTYLTPTLAVFESYILISGRHQENFDRLIQREGQQYTARSIRSGWQAYFDRDFIRNANHADLLNLFEFYKTMTKVFFDAGVPLLTGTDAPGFPGVMSGFGVHEELRLLTETGIPAADAFAIASRNAGQFIDDTLAPEVRFGTIETGNRADLILLTNNPLSSVENLKRPLAVISRGRFWSQTFLQTQLDALQTTIKNRVERGLPIKNLEYLEFCADH